MSDDIQSEALSEAVAAQLSAIRRALRTRMDGAVAQSMREAGLEYEINWGWTRSFIIDLAAEYAPSRELAAALRHTSVRELLILSTLLYPPDLTLGEEEISDYLSMAVNLELQEQLAFNLFSRHKETVVWAVSYINKGVEHEGFAYVALLTMAHALSRHDQYGDALFDDVPLWRSILSIYADETLASQLRRVARTLLDRGRELPHLQTLLPSVIADFISSANISSEEREELQYLIEE